MTTHSAHSRNPPKLRCSYEDDASLVVVKKKKSRAALGDVAWGPQNALGELTNTGHVPPPLAENRANHLKVPTRSDENQGSKWWSIGRGRKEGKDKENGPARSKSKRVLRSVDVELMFDCTAPEPFGKASTEAESRTRFNSLDSSKFLGFVNFTASSLPSFLAL